MGPCRNCHGKLSALRIVFILTSMLMVWFNSESAAHAVVVDGIDWTTGPTQVSLGPAATLEVPAGYNFTGSDGAKIFDERQGNIPGRQIVGVVRFPIGNDHEGWILFSYNAIGYVKDDEKAALTGPGANSMLADIKKATHDENAEKVSRGLPTLEVIDWDQRPFYDPITNHLTWATRGRSSNGLEDSNYDSDVLGRRGVLHAKMVVLPENLKAAEQTYRNVISGISFKDGETYQEFRPGDRVAAIGLTGLITGGVAVATMKLWKPLLAVGTAIIAMIAAAGRKIRQIFGGKRPVTVPASVSTSAPTVITCNQCGQKNRLDKAKGQQAKCARCGKPLAVGS